MMMSSRLIFHLCRRNLSRLFWDTCKEAFRQIMQWVPQPYYFYPLDILQIPVSLLMHEIIDLRGSNERWKGQFLNVNSRDHLLRQQLSQEMGALAFCKNLTLTILIYSRKILPYVFAFIPLLPSASRTNLLFVLIAPHLLIFFFSIMRDTCIRPPEARSLALLEVHAFQYRSWWWEPGWGASSPLQYPNLPWQPLDTAGVQGNCWQCRSRFGCRRRRRDRGH